MTVAGLGGAMLVAIVSHAVSVSMFKAGLAGIRKEQAEMARDTAINAIRELIAGLEKTLYGLSAAPGMKSAFEDLNAGFSRIGDETDLDDLEVRDALEMFYRGSRASMGEGKDAFPLPADFGGRAAQFLFVFGNPYPFGEKNRLISPKDGHFSYAGAHERHHRFFDDALAYLGKCDLLLVNKFGTVVYSRFKNPEFGTNLVTGPFKVAGAAVAFQKAFNTASKGAAFVNFGAYGPIRNRFAAFAGLPIESNGEKIGVVLITIPKSEIDKRAAAAAGNIAIWIDGGFHVAVPDTGEKKSYESGPADVKIFDGVLTVSAGIGRSKDDPLLRDFHAGFALASAFAVVVFATVFSLCVRRFAVFPFMNVFSKVKELSRKKGDLTQKIPVESKDEIGLLAIYLNDFIGTLKTQMEKVKRTSGILNVSVRDLTASSANIRATSNRQAAAVKEVVATMEDSDRQSKTAASKIREVAGIADQTRVHAEEGALLTESNRDKMDEIRTASGKFIDSLKSLGEQINNIGEIIGMINGIADQTRIIAFNAELEASAAGEAGKNFEIVADEIRRLANNTMTSTNEIRERIRVIQSASENLVGMSEDGMRGIDEGWKLSSRLERVFGQILESAETSAESAHMISTSINRQAGASDEILRTLKHLSAGIENLVEETKTTAKASETMMSMSEDLNTVVGKYVVEKAE